MEGPVPGTPDRLPDRALMRVSDADRHRVGEILREAAGEGRLDLDELDERLEAAYAARTYADLEPLTADLPAHPGGPAAARPAAPSPIVPGPAQERHVAIMSGVDRKGVWVVPQQMSVLALMGGASLDMRQAKFAAREVVITVNAFMGGAEIIVNPHTHVVVEGTGIMGGYTGPSEQTPAELDESSPTVRVRGIAVMGGVSVERRPMPGEMRRERRHRLH